MHRLRSAWLFGFAMTLATACSDPAPPTAPTPEERLSGPGEFSVGFTRHEVSYPTPEGAEERTLPVAVWYPTDAPAREPTMYSFRESLEITPDAPPLGGPWPVLIFTHGDRAFGDISSHLMEHFASHGWLVLAPDHTGNTLRDNTNGMRLTSMFYLRPMDLSEVLDHYEELAAPDPFADLMGDVVVVAGHSFGGYTAYAFAGATYAVDELVVSCADGTGREDYCSALTDDAQRILRAGLLDSRVALAIPMASGNEDLFGSSGLGEVRVPVLHLVAEGDGNPAGAAGDDAIWTSLQGAQNRRINFLGAGHNDFTDVCASLVPLRCSMDVDPLEEQRLTRLYSLAFTRARLFNDVEADALLDPSLSPNGVEITLSPASP